MWYRNWELVGTAHYVICRYNVIVHVQPTLHRTRSGPGISQMYVDLRKQASRRGIEGNASDAMCGKYTVLLASRHVKNL